MTHHTPRLERALDLLRALVAVDTRNPPRAIQAESPLFDVIRQALPGFHTELFDLGDGCLSLLATRGTPRVLFNCHVDTVPANASWTRDPLDLLVKDGVAVGLGACDIKGGAACMLAAAQFTQGDVALLFTSDEEAGSSRCVREFIATHRQRIAARGEPDYDFIFVAEPTRCRAVLEHRGIVTYTGHFNGIAGHASQARALLDSAVHEAMRWSQRALDLAEQLHSEARYKNLSGVSFNIGLVEGGEKPNMIADRCRVRWGIRPLPSQEPRQLATQLADLAERPWRVKWEPGFFGPTLPAATGNSPGSARVAAAQVHIERYKLDLGQPVDFWTEAAIFSEAGYDVAVFGPGDIAQAHAADEWVRLSELEQAVDAYCHIIDHDLLGSTTPQT